MMGRRSVILNQSDEKKISVTSYSTNQTLFTCAWYFVSIGLLDSTVFLFDSRPGLGGVGRGRSFLDFDSSEMWWKLTAVPGSNLKEKCEELV